MEGLPGQGRSLQGECQVKAHRATLPHASVTVLRPQRAMSYRGISACLRLGNLVSNLVPILVDKQ